MQEAFDKLNERRVTLIARKHTPGGAKLDVETTRELAELTERCDAVVHALFPLPTIEQMAERLGLPVPEKHVDERQLEMLYACAPPDCAWCGEAHEGGPERCMSSIRAKVDGAINEFRCEAERREFGPEDNGEEPEPAEGAENRLGGRTGPS